MTALWIPLLLHAGLWLIAALIASRMMEWYPKGCRQIFVAIGLDIAAIAIGQLPSASDQLGPTFWTSMLPRFILSLTPPRFQELLIVVSAGMQWIAFGVALDAFFKAGKAAEELRYLQRSGTDRELIKQLDAPRSPRLTSATPTADDDLRDRR